MATTGKEPIGSMGTDTPLAVLSDQAPNMSAYFHQLFAQVTNPPIDPIREALVMSLETTMGPDGNTFDETPEQCHQLRLRGPVIDNVDLAKIRAVHEGVFEPITLPIVWPLEAGAEGLAAALDKLCRAAAAAIDDGHNLLILSDRGVDARHVAMPSLLALSAVQQSLVRDGIRMQAGLVVEAADVREVHDIALLIGYGAAAVNPYLAIDSIAELVTQGRVPGPVTDATLRYVHALEEGLCKVMSKMGISTVQSYRGAQSFEAVGLDGELSGRHFTGTPPGSAASIGGSRRGASARPRLRGRLVRDRTSSSRGHSRRRRGDRTSGTRPRSRRCRPRSGPTTRRSSPSSRPSPTTRSRRSSRSAGCSRSRSTRPRRSRWPTSSPPRRSSSGSSPVRCRSARSAPRRTRRSRCDEPDRARANSGEGGEEPHRSIPRERALRLPRSTDARPVRGPAQYWARRGSPDQDSGRRSPARSVSARQNIDERIARVRCSTPGVTLISPPPHHDIYSIEDLAQLVYDLTCVNPTARVSVKLVSEVGVGTIAAGVAKARAGCVVIAGFEGGTGAAPLSSLKHAGLPWESGRGTNKLVANSSGIACASGRRGPADVTRRDSSPRCRAPRFRMATASLIRQALLLRMHPKRLVGIGTQIPACARVHRRHEEASLLHVSAERLREQLAGSRTLARDIVGASEALRPAGRIITSRRLTSAACSPRPPPPPVAAMPWDITDHVDHDLLRRSGLFERAAATGNRPIELALPIDNSRRAVGALLSGEIARRHGARGLPDNTIRVRFTGAAGQSFGAFLAPGVTLELCGDANDYIGKGLSGGRIVVYPPASARFAPEHNVIVGNVALYGATAGDLFACGLAGERFAVRNSGARAVVEGVGDHGCEYMTGGVVVVLGPVGRNFAAGMSGGTAYVFDQAQTLRARTNLEMVELESVVDESDLWLLYSLVEDHVRFTSSPLGRRVLDNWEHLVARFVKVMPTDYKRVLQQRRAAARPRPPGHLSVVSS